MNILDYAPVEFQEHLKALDNTVKFYKVRLRCELESDSDHQASSSLQHYVLTGNEGVGIPEAIDEIRNRLIGIYNITEYIYRDATTMYDFNEGFESSMNEVCKDDTVICIGNAELLGMRGHINNKTGIEELCNKMGESQQQHRHPVWKTQSSVGACKRS